MNTFEYICSSFFDKMVLYPSLQAIKSLNWTNSFIPNKSSNNLLKTCSFLWIFSSKLLLIWVTYFHMQHTKYYLRADSIFAEILLHSFHNAKDIPKKWEKFERWWKLSQSLINNWDRLFWHFLTEKGLLGLVWNSKPKPNMTEDFSQKALVWRLWDWIRQRPKIFRHLGRR